MTPTLTDALRWTREGTALVGRVVAELTDAQFGEPSLLPGWSRATLLGHVGLNAVALGNLVIWAATGVETPMYGSMEQRNADIERASLEAPADLVARFRTSAADLDAAMAHLSAAAWETEVRTAQGRVVPASDIPWLRAREVLIHAVDLAGSVDWADLPEDFLRTLIAEIAAHRSRVGTGPALRIEAPDGTEWAVEGTGDAASVWGPVPALAAYLAGRETADVTADGGPPVLPPWI